MEYHDHGVLGFENVQSDLVFIDLGLLSHVPQLVGPGIPPCTHGFSSEHSGLLAIEDALRGRSKLRPACAARNVRRRGSNMIPSPGSICSEPRRMSNQALTWGPGLSRSHRVDGVFLSGIAGSAADGRPKLREGRKRRGDAGPGWAETRRTRRGEAKLEVEGRPKSVVPMVEDCTKPLSSRASLRRYPEFHLLSELQVV